MVDAALVSLEEGLCQIGVEARSETIDKLTLYLDLLETWSRAFNLTAVRSRQQMISRHILESLAIAPFLSGARRVDVGSGAGLPGIPLAIVEPHRHYTLLDSNGKKTRFLTEVKTRLGLANVAVVTERVEHWRPQERFDAVLTRAFADLPTTCGKIAHLLDQSGQLFAMKSQDALNEAHSIPPTMEYVAQLSAPVPGQADGVKLMIVRHMAGRT